MQKKTKSLLEALNDVATDRNRDSLIETRATHVINSAVNLIALIKETYDHDSATDLERRLVLAIKGSDAAKFVRGIRKVRDERTTIKK